MWRSSVLVPVLALTGCAAEPPANSSAALQTEAEGELRPVAAFAAIADRRERSVALFAEAGKVLQHPRCLNCHPADRRPTQGDDLHPHSPPMHAGDANHGPPGMACNACHGTGNVATLGDGIRSVPGDAHWSLAPASMAWQGLSLGDICRQLKDLERNGNRNLAKIHEHMTTDHLVGWAWAPGAGRTPAPGSQVRFGELIQAWIDTGAECPRA